MSLIFFLFSFVVDCFFLHFHIQSFLYKDDLKLDSYLRRLPNFYIILCTSSLFIALPSPEVDNNQKRQRRIFRSQILRHMALSAKEGSDLKLLQSQAARAKALSETKNSEGREKVSVYTPFDKLGVQKYLSSRGVLLYKMEQIRLQ